MALFKTNDVNVLKTLGITARTPALITLETCFDGSVHWHSVDWDMLPFLKSLGASEPIEMKL